MFDYCLIMAGGSGTRLWPASSSKKPKQFLPVAKGKSETFFSLSLQRALRVIEKTGKVIIIAGKTHLPLVIAACSALSASDKKRVVLIPEPQAKNTAPAIACAAAFARKTGGKNSTMLVLTSDHIIRPVEVFINDARTAAQFAAHEQLAVFGISPSRPETGYGYIKTEKKRDDSVYSVAEFREKPDLKTAKKLAASGRFFWNSGMFAFNTEFLAGEFSRLADDVSRPFEKLIPPDKKSYTSAKGIKVLSKWEGLNKAYRQTKSISFDYAVVSLCSRIVMVRANFDWIDVGSWDEYARLLSASTETYASGCDNCLVDSDIPVALAGVKDLIVVIRLGKDGSPTAALIAKKGETQRVKDLVEQMRKHA